MKHLITNTPRELVAFSNDGKKRIVAKLQALQDGYSVDCGATYKGSVWSVQFHTTEKRYGEEVPCTYPMHRRFCTNKWAMLFGGCQGNNEFSEALKEYEAVTKNVTRQMTEYAKKSFELRLKIKPEDINEY